ncbi:MAG: tetratricopeptide repeat protein [Limnochordia bacterium]|nr:tetratricopeptide repeat protein [Bacillota bacterium]NLL08490.1 tetratricopeptide repeat protein [Bacillota bacterium]HBG08574.1 hypothetical protein [Bacillota bacterium]
MRKLSLVRNQETERNEVVGEQRQGSSNGTERQAARKKLEWVESLFAQDRPLKVSVLQKMYSELFWVKNEVPELFEGDTVYLWEQLAFAFHYYGQLKQAERCLRIQAELQPDKSDAFLNLGVFLTDAGYYDAAIAAYREGLKRTPHCEFINYNLASLAAFLGRHELAQSALNEALVANPSRGLNQLAKGQLSMEREQYEPAVQYLQEALDWAREEDLPGQQLECLRSLGFAYLKLKQLDQAEKVLEEAVSLDPDCAASHELLAQCHKLQGNQWLFRQHWKRAKELARDL